jgi:RHS repeat-associated protein
MITQKNANSHVTCYEYNGVKQRTAVVRPLLQRSETEYVKGNLVEATDFNGDQIIYNYNLLNQLTGKRFVDEGDRTVTFTYDDAGKRHTAIDSRGTTTDEYNEMGQLISRVMPDSKSIRYTYDKVTGQVATVTTDSGTTTNHYNDLGQLDRVTSSEGVTTYLYNAVGNLSLTTYPNGITESRQYDNLDRLAVLENKNSSGVVLSRYQYTYDKVGNKASVLELGGRKVEYTYDELNRLTQEKITDAVNGNRVIDYTFDAVGNRLSRVDSVAGTTTYTYDDNDRLLSETTAGVTKRYTYDDNGNTLTEQEPGKRTVYDWDSENRLIGAQITDTSGTKTVQYRYDVEGDRVSSTVNGVETRYLVDGNRTYSQVLEEYSSTGGTQVTYTYGQGLIAQRRSGVTTSYLYDGHSGVRQLSSEDGAITDSYAYDAFGSVLTAEASTFNSHLYRSEQIDRDTGLQYLRARYYDINIGRFTSVDPFEGVKEQSMSRHQYQYGYNNPVVNFDSSGLFNLTELSGVMATLATLAPFFTIYIGSVQFTATAFSPGGGIEWESSALAIGFNGPAYIPVSGVQLIKAETDFNGRHIEGLIFTMSGSIGLGGVEYSLVHGGATLISPVWGGGNAAFFTGAYNGLTVFSAVGPEGGVDLSVFQLGFGLGISTPSSDLSNYGFSLSFPSAYTGISVGANFSDQPTSRTSRIIEVPPEYRQIF